MVSVLTFFLVESRAPGFKGGFSLSSDFALVLTTGPFDGFLVAFLLFAVFPVSFLVMASATAGSILLLVLTLSSPSGFPFNNAAACLLAAVSVFPGMVFLISWFMLITTF